MTESAKQWVNYFEAPQNQRNTWKIGKNWHFYGKHFQNVGKPILFNIKHCKYDNHMTTSSGIDHTKIMALGASILAKFRWRIWQLKLASCCEPPYTYPMCNIHRYLILAWNASKLMQQMHNRPFVRSRTWNVSKIQHLPRSMIFLDQELTFWI